MKTLGKKLINTENTIEAFAAACLPCICDYCGCAPDEPAGPGAISGLSSNSSYYHTSTGL
ncbi:CLI_3235 family bacteriocin precursor [Sporobacter termitidis]|uniref:CLI_3235 family bacteriocin precursor n=1 Tax=Sporobacter termitidis TaxID=44749 RepID=UPI0009337F5A|nr:CLI_3235 family bacteriocin precursor [Sporobacter termitidis]